jgi:hypothetical protein
MSNIVPISFDALGSLPAEAWSDGEAIGDAGLAVVLPPVVEEDASGTYLGAGTTVLARGDLSPLSQATRVTLTVELAATGKARVVLPYNADAGNYAVLELKRRTDNKAELTIFLTDPLGSLSMWTAAIAKPGTSAAIAGLLTVEAGPRFLRAWWDPAGRRVMRRTPDVGAYIPEIEHGAWGVCGFASKVRSIELETPLSPGDDPGCRLTAVEEASVASDVHDASTAVLIRYDVVPHTKSRRAQLCVASYGASSDGVVADTLSHRLDPSQTIVLIPPGQDVVLAACSIAESRSGIHHSELTVNVDGDPSGSLTGGIGSGRATLAVGGEGFLDPGIILASKTQMVAEQDDLVSDTGGQEERQQVASRQRRAWEIGGRLKGGSVRRIERLIGACGGIRPAWFVPPLTHWPVAVITPGVRHDTEGLNRVESTLSPMEA